MGNMINTFKPLEFLDLANRLGVPMAGEADMRTAVGRTYYAVFLTARDKTGVITTQGTHREVNRRVKRQLGGGIGSQLKSLERLRNVADYEMLPVDPGDRNWETNLGRARAIAGYILPKIQAI